MLLFKSSATLNDSFLISTTLDNLQSMSITLKPRAGFYYSVQFKFNFREGSMYNVCTGYPYTVHDKVTFNSICLANICSVY